MVNFQFFGKQSFLFVNDVKKRKIEKQISLFFFKFLGLVKKEGFN